MRSLLESPIKTPFNFSNSKDFDQILPRFVKPILKPYIAMKSICYLLCVALFLVSCSESLEEKAIKSFVQRVDDKTSLDLAVKIVELNAIEPIMGSDSLKLIDSVIEATIKKLIEKNRLDSIRQHFDIEEVKIELKYESDKRMRELITNQLKSNQDILDLTTKILANLRAKNISNTNTYTRALSKLKEHYTLNQNKPLVLRYNCKYTFKNPALGGVEQETTKTFIMDTLKTKVISGY